VEAHGEAAGSGRESPAAAACATAMWPAAGTVARLAADADLREARRERASRRVVVLAHVGGVAVGTHEVPVLLALRPVQFVGVREVLARVEVEPALAALVLRPRVPRDRQRLHVAAGQLDQVLLQGKTPNVCRTSKSASLRRGRRCAP